MNKGQTTSGWKITIPQAASFILAGIYLSGFLGLNVHLGKHGVFDFDLASSRYLIVGVLFFSFLVFWYLFGGRAIIFGTKRLRNELALVERSDLGPVWKGLSYVNFLIELTFQHLLSAALFSHLILGDKEPTQIIHHENIKWESVPAMSSRIRGLRDTHRKRSRAAVGETLSWFSTPP